jgi:RNA polymerase sigma factor (sigma-70 family)
VNNQPAVDASLHENGSSRDPMEVLRPHLGWLRTVIRARLIETSDVEDVLQNVACAVAGSSNLPADARHLAPWLYRVAVRQVLQVRRQAGRRKRVLAAWIAERRQPEANDPVRQLMAIESRMAVRAALDRLGDVDRQVLLLKYTENWSYLDLAHHLGVSTGAIEHRLLKARERLREELRSSHSPDRE